MHHIEHLSRDTWSERSAWFDLGEEAARSEGSFLLAEEACALTADVKAAVCAGAWAAVLILAIAVVDASLREMEVRGFSGNTGTSLRSPERTANYDASYPSECYCPHKP
jgi:hypothetical protein